MHTTHQTPAVAITAQAVSTLDTQLVVIPVFEDDDLADLPTLDAATSGELGRARGRGECRGELYELLVTPLAGGGWKAARAACVGAGRRADVDAERLRRVVIVGCLAARARRLTTVAVVHRQGVAVPIERAVQAMTEGAVVANFEGAAYKQGAHPRVFVESVALRLDTAPAGLSQTVARARVMGECTNMARALANEPGNVLTPREFAVRATDLAAAAGLGVEVLDEAAIERLKMGLLLGVARGSAEPPRVVVLRHDPPGAPVGPVLGLVGKGITFDTGGISIKPADNMDKMKDDMSGGAAVLCAMAAIARLKGPIRCIGVIPLAENMPGSRALKPGDIITSAEGKTVEVLNTDAEGRLVLGDGLWYARQRGATHLVDVATLTGACVVALGKTTTGLFGAPDAWVAEVRRASDRAFDRSWPMPTFDDYKELLKSEIADFTNVGGRAGGAISAALFLKEFSGGLPWAHLDIAGTAWVEDASSYAPKGPTGVAVRTLAELALGAEGWSTLGSAPTR